MGLLPPKILGECLPLD